MLKNSLLIGVFVALSLVFCPVFCPPTVTAEEKENSCHEEQGSEVPSMHHCCSDDATLAAQPPIIQQTFFTQRGLSTECTLAPVDAASTESSIFLPFQMSPPRVMRA